MELLIVFTDGRLFRRASSDICQVLDFAVEYVFCKLEVPTGIPRVPISIVAIFPAVVYFIDE